MDSSSHQSTPKDLIITHLEMTHPGQFIPAFLESGAEHHPILKMEIVDVAFYRFLYSAVGAVWHWRDRLRLSDDELQHILSQPSNSVYTLFSSGVPAGYVELEASDDETRIAYFGLRPQFHGKGLGKHLLSIGIQEAWARGNPRLTVHTNNLDGPYALTNYLKRGFSVHHLETHPMPERYQ